MKHITKLKKLYACSDAIAWAKDYKTFQEAWDKCERADWMLWIAGKMIGKNGCSTRKEVVLVACKCARTALKYLPKDEKRPLKCIQIVEKWARGEATISEVRKARRAATAYAADAATAADAADAAYAAAAATAYAAAAAATTDAADAAYAAYAADAAYAAYAADAAATADATKIKTLKKLANIVRKHLKVNL